MMVTTDRGAAEDLADILNARDFALVLFVNDRMPTRGDVREDYVEASFPGYGPIVLTASSWTIREGREAVATAGDQEWRQTADARTEERVFGYLVVDAATGALRRADRFAAGPFSMMRENDRITLEPTITLRNAPNR
jgi:hypothetical protein